MAIPAVARRIGAHARPPAGRHGLVGARRSPSFRWRRPRAGARALLVTLLIAAAAAAAAFANVVLLANAERSGDPIGKLTPLSWSQVAPAGARPASASVRERTTTPPAGPRGSKAAAAGAAPSRAVRHEHRRSGVEADD